MSIVRQATSGNFNLSAYNRPRDRSTSLSRFNLLRGTKREGGNGDRPAGQVATPDPGTNQVSEVKSRVFFSLWLINLILSISTSALHPSMLLFKHNSASKASVASSSSSSSSPLNPKEMSIFDSSNPKSPLYSPNYQVVRSRPSLAHLFCTVLTPSPFAAGPQSG